MHKFRESRIPAQSVQQLRLLYTEREKVIKCFASFEKTSENKGFISKNTFKVVASVNKMAVKQLKDAMKCIESKMLSVITSENKLNQQYNLITSIPGIGMQTAIYLLIATKGFSAFDNW